MANRGIVPDEGNTPEAISSLAYLIARSIKSKGLKPTKFVSEAIGKDEIDELKKDIRNVFDIEFNEKEPSAFKFLN